MTSKSKKAVVILLVLAVIAIVALIVYRRYKASQAKAMGDKTGTALALGGYPNLAGAVGLGRAIF